MELDFSREWRVIAPRGSDENGPASFAALELAAIIGRCELCLAPVPGAESDAEPLIILIPGAESEALPADAHAAPRFSWRASPGRVEIYGEGEGALLRGVYDFLAALGARWPGPGEEGERLPRGPILALATGSRASAASALPTTLILGHGAYLERWRDYLPWAARAGYSSVFIHTTPDVLAMGAAPESLYEALRPPLAEAARRLGLVLELGGHGLSTLLPRSLFGGAPELFRESGGRRVNDRNFCPSSEAALRIVTAAFIERALAHPEVAVFHAWPDDLPGGGWCSCPDCAALSPAAQSLKVACALAAALASSRPGASLSFLAYHDTGDAASILGTALPPNLELLWAPRLRSWGSAYGDPGNALNAASLASFRRAARAWRASGGGRVAVFEYWEDAVLFKAAVPPLSAVIEGDLAAYRDEGGEGRADVVGILCTGGRLPLAPRPNAAILPRLAAAPGTAAPAAREEALADWAGAAYGPAAAPMLDYWRELEAAWAIDLDIDEGDTAIRMPDSVSRYAIDPPADWGDPWKADAPRLESRRGRCEELFDHLRRAENLLREAKLGATDGREARAVLGEASEYAISGAVLELDCARLSAYHELAGGDARAAADVANLALSASGAVRKALSVLPDPRSRRESRLLIAIFYDLRLRAIRRANARSGLRRLLDLWFTAARIGLAILPVLRSYEAKAIASAPRRR